MITWKEMVYTIRINNYEKAMNGIEFNFDIVAIKHVNVIWLSPYYTKFVKFWIDYIFHYSYYTTLQVESLHSAIKG